jgi:hypothetical protein
MGWDVYIEVGEGKREIRVDWIVFALKLGKVYAKEMSHFADLIIVE